MAWFPELAKLLKGDKFDIPEGTSKKEYYEETVFPALKEDVAKLQSIKVANIPVDGSNAALKPILKLLNFFTSGLTAFKIFTIVGLAGLFDAVEKNDKNGALLWCKNNPKTVELGKNAIGTFAKGNDTKTLPALFDLVEHLGI